MLHLTSETLSVAVVNVIHILANVTNDCRCVNTRNEFDIGML